MVRHGVTPTTGKVLPGRAPGLHLGPAGIEQAEAAAGRIASMVPAPVAVYSSPMERTRETAAPIARALGLQVRPQKGLLDTAVGDWQGRTFKSLSTKPQWRRVHEWPTGFRFPGGESIPEMSTRVVSTVLGLAEEHRGERIVCVSHADPIRLVLSSVAGIPLDLSSRLAISPGSVSAIAVGDLAPMVLWVNATSCLEELMPR
ncbi:MAG: histidine phosphatase family protein [Acidimicrobiales bacterium]